MQQRVLKMLRSPTGNGPLQLEDAAYDAAGRVMDGRLLAPAGVVHRVRAGIPRFVDVDDEGQQQVKDSFGFKWQNWDADENAAPPAWYTAWISTKYGFGSPAELTSWMRSRDAILDAGCGGAETASIWLTQPGPWSNYVGMDISTAVDVARARFEAVPEVTFVQGDVLDPPFEAASFDTVFSEGVLHHTPSTQRAIASMARLLRPGGEMLFYVYAKKGPLREFADDYLRHTLADLSDAEFLDRMRPITRLAKVLHETGAEVDVPEAIPELGIPAGRQSVQRLIYWSFLKAFWNPESSFEQNNLINFDWYRPRYAHRQSPAEVRAWCEQAGLRVTFQNVEPSGITVRATRA